MTANGCWTRSASGWNWGAAELPGAEAAWKLFRPPMLDAPGGLAALSHGLGVLVEPE